jgi:uncharacterized protein (TIGR00297 family)
MSALGGRELARKLVHIGVGAIAFAVRDLGPWWSALCALVAILFNVVVLPRLGGKKLWRSADEARGYPLGIVLYPTAVLLLILAFHDRLEVAAAIWGILAFGDGFASLVGMSLGGPKLPWNRRKTVSGSLAYFLFGTAGATVLLLWTAPGQYSVAFALAAAAVTALIAALVESLPIELDDNISVPPIAALVLWGLLLGQAGWAPWLAASWPKHLAVAVAVNIAFAIAGYASRGVDRSGALAGFLIGATIWGFLGWRGYLLLLAFFVIGTSCTKIGYRRKAALNLAQEKGGRRSARHAIANAGCGAFCAVVAATADPYWSTLWTLGFAGAFATAAADTAGSEIGQLWGRRTFLVTTLRSVPRGTQGAVSVEGTLASLVGAGLIAFLGFAVGLYGVVGALLVTLAGFLGALLESFIGATIERRGLLDNETTNFLNTLIGAILAAVAGAVFL